MIWCSPEARGRNTARTTTQEQSSRLNWVVSSCTGTQKKETLTNYVITPCMVMKTKGIPSCTGTPGQPLKLRHVLIVTVCGHARCLWAKFPLIPILHYAYSLLLKKKIAQTIDYLWDYPLCFQEVEFFLSLYSNLRKVRK